jgi:hypothetical protein
MTMPHERSRAVLWTREFLQELLDSRQTPGVSDRVRERARTLLRHFPSRGDMAMTGRALPTWWDACVGEGEGEGEGAPE